jgi:hypothetical protein
MAPESAFMRAALVVSVIAALAGAASAQSSTATLQGTITDAGGGVLPGVVVKLQSPATGLVREAVTNGAGVFVFNFLPAGQYEIGAELTGFKSLRQADVSLEIGQSLQLDLKMAVGQLEEVVTVEGTAALLDRTSPSIATVIAASHLKDLPPTAAATSSAPTSSTRTANTTSIRGRARRAIRTITRARLP